MTEEQEKHLERVQQQSVKAIDSKYRRGQAEHGGDLFRMPIEELLQNALDENTDQRVYILTAMERMEELSPTPIAENP